MKRNGLLLLTIIVVGMNLAGCSDQATEPLPGPMPSFSWSGSTLAPATITFNNLSENADEYNWNFGDGTTSNEKNPVHIFQTPRTYFITLIATQSSSGASRGFSQYLTITGNPPIVDFDWSGDTIAPATIRFQNLTLNGDTYEWDFGDRTTSDAASPTHIYHSGGTYYVTLSATNSVAQITRSATKTIRIVWQDPTADFEWTGKTVVNNYITFINRSRGASEIHWNFGNGWETKPDSFRYIFAHPDNYPVSLAAFNPTTSKGDTITKILPISPSKVSLMKISIIQIPFVDSTGYPWDQDSGPDLVVIVYDPHGSVIFNGDDGTADLRQNMLPFGLIPNKGSYEVPYEDWSSNLRIEFLEIDLLPARYYRPMGTLRFGIEELKNSQGYLDKYSVERDLLHVELEFEWDE